MVTSFLQGGLGNQMFQISYAISESKKYGVQYKFKPEAYTPMQANQPSKYIDNIYRNIDFSMSDEEYSNSLVFNGYFQSLKYFKDDAEEIKELFSPPEDFLKKIYQIYPELYSPRSLSIHIRRGDYLTISDILPVIDISYINSSLQALGEYDVGFVFSDDKNWAKDNFNNNKIIIVENLEDYEELWMMSLCKNNIISNSTFSWWGSFLNKNIEKKVIAPSLWTGPKGPNMDEIYLDNFIKIPIVYNEGLLKALNN
jgi:hypothetical protein